MADNPNLYPMRAPCRECGEPNGVREMKGRQDTVRCASCGRFQYNAPRVETGAPTATVRSREDISPGLRSRVLERCDNACWECGRRPPAVILHVGHLISVDDAKANGWADEQANHPLNLIAACEECNLGRGKRSFPPQSAIRYAMAVLKIGMNRGVQ